MAESGDTPRWKFLNKVPGMPSADGNITRIFNTGDSRPPASFRELVDRSDGQALSAAIYGREGIANCIDASYAGRNYDGVLGLRFTFQRHNKQRSKEIWSLLGLGDLKARAETPGVERKELGLGAEDCLSAGDSSLLRTLMVEERGGGGMPGALTEDDSVLARALISVGEAQTMAGAAGAYGYGKAAVAQASRVRTVFAYTCFPAPGGSTVTRRLVGVTYWGNHSSGGKRYTGWALFGLDAEGGSVVALEDRVADAFAVRLGIPLRSASEQLEHGTTFLIVDPVFEAPHLKGAIELFWWPLLQRTRSIGVDVEIVDEDGEVHTPAVDENHPLLGQFVDAFLAAEQARESRVEIRDANRRVKVGEAGVTSLVVRGSDSPITQSLVAAMRSPLMVVGYDNAPSARPAMLGVFVADPSKNENLRRVEPPEHDKWQRQNVGGLNASREDIRISLLVRQERDQAIEELRPPDPEPVYGISAFSRHFPGVDSKVARPRIIKPKEVKQRLVRVHLVHADDDNELVVVERPTRVSAGDGMLGAVAEVKFFMDETRAKKVGRKSLQATVTIGAKVAEEGGTSSEWWPSVVSQHKRGAESDFTRVSAMGVSPAVFEGTFTIGSDFYFTIETDPYPNDWTMEMVFDCSPWDVVAPAASHFDQEGGAA